MQKRVSSMAYDDAQRVLWNLPTTQVDYADDANIYSRWTLGDSPEWITRDSIQDSILTSYKAHGLWADRATLEYTPFLKGV
jgi:hypothetical protein